MTHTIPADADRDMSAASCGPGSRASTEPVPVSALSGFDPSPLRILDVASGSRMFWFDRQHPDAMFVDNRREQHELTDASSRGGSRSLVVDPDLVADFTALPFPDGSFPLVVFDPPHLVRNGSKGWLAKKYGRLGSNWRIDIRKGFAECFRVLRPDGVLVFKWNEHEIPVSQVLALTDVQPLFGNRCGRTAKSHWLVFIKPRPSSDVKQSGDLLDLIAINRRYELEDALADRKQRRLARSPSAKQGHETRRARLRAVNPFEREAR